MNRWFTIVLFVLLLTACVNGGEAFEVVETPTKIPLTPTNTPVPTNVVTLTPTNTPYPINTTTPSEENLGDEEWPCPSFKMGGTIIFQTQSGLKSISNKGLVDIYNTEEAISLGGYSKLLDALIIRVGNRNIYSIDLNGENETLLYSATMNIYLTGLSPDGSKLTFNSSNYSKRDLYLLDLTSKELKTYPTNYGVNFNWHPDGETIIFNDGWNQLEALAINDSSIKELNIFYDSYLLVQSFSDSDLYLSDPKWSHDGEYIAYRPSYMTGHSSQINIYKPDLDSIIHVLELEDPRIVSYSWSPNEHLIAFFFRDEPEKASIYIYNVVSNEHSLLIDDIDTLYMGGLEAPVWLEDGEYLLLDEDINGFGNLVLVDVRTKKTCRLIGLDWSIYEYHWIDETE